MRDLRDILEAVEAASARGEATALATIVGAEGSTYRREGARLLVTAGGRLVGNISGGCLEGDIQVVGQEVLREGAPRLVSYDLTADDDLVWGLGLGCNGRIDVFVETVAGTGRQALDLLRRALDDERSVAVALVVRGTAAVPAGSRLALDPGGAVLGEVPDREAADRLLRAARAGLQEGRSRRRAVPTDAGDVDVFVEVLRPPIRLVVCGAGHDAVPLVAQGVALGWRVVVVDRREAFLTAERFPGARLLQVGFREAGAEVPVDDRTAVVVMTHNYIHDRDVLRGLLLRPGPHPAYIGMLGPRQRTEQILADLARDGVEVPASLRPHLYGPVGLDVGSEGAEEIAAAAVAEILAVDRGRPAGFLRDRRGSIHARSST